MGRSAEYERYSVMDRRSDLADIAVPFYRDVQEYAEGLPADAEVTVEPGAHDAAYWRRMLADELAFLGAAVGSGA